MPRLRLMRQITFSNAFGSKFIPLAGHYQVLLQILFRACVQQFLPVLL